MNDFGRLFLTITKAGEPSLDPPVDNHRIFAADVVVAEGLGPRMIPTHSHLHLHCHPPEISLHCQAICTSLWPLQVWPLTVAAAAGWADDDDGDVDGVPYDSDGDDEEGGATEVDEDQEHEGWVVL